MAAPCALDADGNLKNASDIEFFESKTDSRPIGGPAIRENAETRHGFYFFLFDSNLLMFILGRRDKKGSKMNQYLAEECLDSDGEVSKKPLQWWLGHRSQFPKLYNLVCGMFSIPGNCYFNIFCINLTDICLCRLSGGCGTYIFWWP